MLQAILQAIFLHEFCISFLRNQTDFVSERSEPQIGIVLSQQNAVFGARGEHAVGSSTPLVTRSSMSTRCRLIALQGERCGSAAFCGSVDSGYQALSSRFFVSRSSVYLSGKEEPAHFFRFERVRKLRWGRNRTLWRSGGGTPLHRGNTEFAVGLQSVCPSVNSRRIR